MPLAKQTHIAIQDILADFFMGTDDWERLTWPTTLDEYVKERLKNTVWTQSPVRHYIKFIANDQIAWLDKIIVSKR